MFNAMCEELFGVPFDVLEGIFDDEPEIVAGCRKAINEAIANRTHKQAYPAFHELQDRCSWEDEPSPLDWYNNDGDCDGDVDFMSRVGIPFGDGDDNGCSGFTEPDDDLPF